MHEPFKKKAVRFRKVVHITPFKRYLHFVLIKQILFGTKRLFFNSVIPLDPWERSTQQSTWIPLPSQSSLGLRWGELFNCEPHHSELLYLKFERSRAIKLQNYQVLQLSHIIWWLHNFALRNSTEGALSVVIFETECSLLPKISRLCRRAIF